VGIGGPVGSGKTALTLQLCLRLRESRSLAVVTNDIFTREDADFLRKNAALPADRIAAVETGGCPFLRGRYVMRTERLDTGSSARVEGRRHSWTHIVERRVYWTRVAWGRHSSARVAGRRHS